MFYEFRNQLLQKLGWVCLGVAACLYFLIRFIPDLDQLNTYLWVIQTFMIGAALCYTSQHWPRRNYSGWLFVGWETFVHLAMMVPEVEVYGHIQSDALYTLPVMSSFLVGRKGGAISSLLLFLGMMIVYAMYGFDMNVFGENGVISVMIWVTVAFLANMLEGVRSHMEDYMDETMLRDSLTGLTNRRGFMDLLKIAMRRGKPFRLVMMDFDHFHRTNLVLGEHKADQILIKVSRKLAENREIMDLSRHYGDSFVWIVDGQNEIESKLLWIQDDIKKMGRSLSLPLALNVSFGYTSWVEKGPSAKELWSQTELALKRAKSDGRNCIRTFVYQDAEQERHDGELVHALEQAIENREIQVHFQPKVSLESQSVIGMESLVRWVHPQRGFIPPNEFIYLAEQSGLIHALSEQVTEKSIEFLGELIHSGYDSMTVSINISPVQVMRGDLKYRLEYFCQIFDVPPSQIYLEITEGLLVQDGSVDAMQELREAGYKLALDDFGTGYSSLSYLHRFRFDELKVDKSFTDGIAKTEKERQIFNTVLRLSDDLGYATVVEGVETSEQMSYISSLGIPQIQGWYFSKALPPDEFRTYLQNFAFVR